MHFYHQYNMFSNPPEQFSTNVEVEFPLYLSREMPLLSPKSKFMPDEDNVPSVLCWLVSSRELDADYLGIGGPPHAVHVDNTNQPDVDVCHAPQLMSLKPD
jgi:hypothetical protein